MWEQKRVRSPCWKYLTTLRRSVASTPRLKSIITLPSLENGARQSGTYHPKAECNLVCNHCNIFEHQHLSMLLVLMVHPAALSPSEGAEANQKSQERRASWYLEGQTVCNSAGQIQLEALHTLQIINTIRRPLVIAVSDVITSASCRATLTFKQNHCHAEARYLKGKVWLTICRAKTPIMSEIKRWPCKKFIAAGIADWHQL